MKHLVHSTWACLWSTWSFSLNSTLLHSPAGLLSPLPQGFFGELGFGHFLTCPVFSHGVKGEQGLLPMCGGQFLPWGGCTASFLDYMHLYMQHNDFWASLCSLVSLLATIMFSHLPRFVMPPSSASSIDVYFDTSPQQFYLPIGSIHLHLRAFIASMRYS